MFESIKKVLSQLQSRFMALPIGKKVIVLTVVAVITAGLIVMIIWEQKPEFHILYSNVSSEDMGLIVERLKEERVPYQLTAGGTAVMVSSDKVYEVRIKLAGEGLPHGAGVGFEIFDKTQMGMTEFVQRLNYQRALQGELARTINSFEEVEYSRVHIVTPERSLFVGEERKPTASVVLKLKGGKRLKEGQVQGILHLVASSVEGIDPSDVTVVDIQGHVLFGGEKETFIGKLTTTQMEFQQNIERGLENKVQTMLENVIGQGKAIVRVATELDLQQIEKTEESYDPEGQVIRSEQRAEEKSIGEGLGIGGIPGVASNIPPGQTSSNIAGTPSKGEKLNETINYEINKVTKHIIEPTGEIKILSVAVMIDGTYSEDNKYIPRTAEDMKKYEDIVKTAIGYNKERGDKVEVVNVPFESIRRLSEEKKEIEAESKKGKWILIARYAIIGIVILLLFFLVLRPITMWITTVVEKRGVELPKTVAEMEADLGATMPGLGKKEIRKKIQEIAEKSPDTMAELIRKWLREK
ncbi:MAG: flagellar M-ring protein FliF [Nitrospinae bacterium]|nr:flagellar M-ring protein FliF [Nitrospinota bacterium]